jgi:hypothetical protein
MKMNKKVVKVSGIVLAGALIFGGGFFSKQISTLATTDWQTTEYMDANTALGKIGFDKKNEIVENAPTDINAKIDTEINKTVDQQKAELETLLDQYYQMKLNGLVDSPEYKTLESRISALKSDIFNRYAAEIDQVFASQTTTN